MPSVSIEKPCEAYTGVESFAFVSYAHSDAALVYPEIRRLHDMGYRLWYDEGIDPGNEWPEEIAKAISRAAQFIVFITESAILSENVRREINYALKLKKPFLATHLAETILPPGMDLQMSSIQAILKWRMKDEDYIKKLERVLSDDIVDKKKRHAEADIVEKQKRHAEGFARVVKTAGDRPRGYESFHYEAKIRLSSIYARSRNLSFVQDAVGILTELREKYYDVIEIGYELAFAFMELSDLDKEHRDIHNEKAQKLLVELDYQLPDLGVDVESLCRIGRFWKDRADEFCEKGLRESRKYYEQSLEKYEAAYSIHKDYYPGINVAIIYWLLDKKEKAQKTAREVLAQINDYRDVYKSDGLWIAFTAGEAYLLLEEVPNSIKYYTEACAHPDCWAQSKEVMKRQVLRILKRQTIDDTQKKELLDVFDSL